MRKWLLTGLLVSPAWAVPDCQYSITVGNFTGVVQDIAQVIPQTFSISRGSNSTNCDNYQAYFAKGQANSYQRRAYSGQNSLPYNLYRTVNLGNVLKDYNDAGTGEYLSAALPSTNTNYTGTWYVEVKSKDALFSVPPGTYTDTLPINFYGEKENETQVYQTSRWITLSFVVPRFAEVSVVPVNQPHNPNSTVFIMDFGQMVPQEELQADLLIKANVPYGMHVSSTNGGFLKKSPATTNVPYQIQVGNSGWITPTTNSYWLGQEFSGSSQSGRRYNIKVRLGNFGQLDDGDYEETVTITVSAY